MTIKALLFTASCAVAFITSPAFASVANIPLPPTEYEVRVGGMRTDTDTPGNYSSAHATATTQANPMPALTTTVSVGNAQDEGNIYMRYHYVINGPENVLVPVSLSGLIRLTAQAGNTAQANSGGQADLPTPFTSDFASLQIGRGGSNYGAITEMTFNLHGTTYTNGVNSIILRAFSGARGSRDDGGSGSAYVDPVLSIDPSFFATHDRSLYSLSFSNGIVNGLTGAVPEPATWAMLILGFGVVGGALRRRRSTGAMPAVV